MAEIGIIFKIAALGLVIALLCIILKKADRNEEIFAITIVGLVIVLTWVVQYVTKLFETVETLFRF